MSLTRDRICKINPGDSPDESESVSFKSHHDFSIDVGEITKALKDKSFWEEDTIRLKGITRSFIEHCLENVEVTFSKGTFKLKDIPARIKFFDNQTYTICWIDNLATSEIK